MTYKHETYKLENGLMRDSFDSASSLYNLLNKNLIIVVGNVIYTVEKCTEKDLEKIKKLEGLVTFQ